MSTTVAALAILFVGITSASWMDYHQKLQQNQGLPNGANLAQNDSPEKLKYLAQANHHEQAALKKIKKATAVSEEDPAKPNKGYQIQETFNFAPSYSKIKVQKSVPVVFFGYKLIQDEEQVEPKVEGKAEAQTPQQELSPKPKLEEEKKPINEQQPAFDEKELAEFYKWYKW